MAARAGLPQTHARRAGVGYVYPVFLCVPCVNEFAFDDRARIPALLLLGKKSQHLAGELIGEPEPRFGSRVKVENLRIQPDHHRLPPAILRPRKVIGRMPAEFLVLLDGVVIQSQTLARLSLRAS